MVENRTADGIPIASEGDISPYRSPKPRAVHGEYIQYGTVVQPGNKDGQLPFCLRFGIFVLQLVKQAERRRTFHTVAFAVHHIAVRNVFLVLLLDVFGLVFHFVGITAQTDGREDSPLFLNGNVGLLPAFQCHGGHRKKHRHDDYHHRSIYDNINVAVLIHGRTTV